MKRYLSHLGLLALASLLALIAIAQVPSGILPAGMILGGSSAQSAGAHGTASFTVSGGVISALTVTGCVTGVSYTGVGNYTVTVSGCPTSYAITCAGASATVSLTCQVNPASSYSATGFLMTFVANVTSFNDPDRVWIGVL